MSPRTVPVPKLMATLPRLAGPWSPGAPAAPPAGPTAQLMMTSALPLTATAPPLARRREKASVAAPSEEDDDVKDDVSRVWEGSAAAP